MSHETQKNRICPYNTAHTIMVNRMQTHLHKCRKNYPSEDWAYCIHNSTHHMPRMEVEYHEMHLCPDRHSYQSSKFEFDTEVQQPIIPIQQIDLPDPTENWDDGQVNNFDPKKNAAEKCLIRGVHCVPPAERKAFRLEHRRHLQQREEEEIAKGPIKTLPKKAEKPPAPDAPLEPLRAPKEQPKGFIGRGGRLVSGAVAPNPDSLGFSSLSLNSAEKAPGTTSTSQDVPSVHNGSPRTFGRGKPVSMTASDAGNVSSLPSAWGRGRPAI